jgi:lipopolysaccharide transport system ATP-binding protein
MSDIVIRAEGLSKKYFIGHQVQSERYTALRDVVARAANGLVRSMLRGRQLVAGEVEEFWALKDVNFDIKRGEAVGIIGRNGAGKSTLLKILSRITEPSAGRVSIKGRVASLLEVGTGFHPELTGRENIFLNGAILGMTRAEIRAKFDEIVAFAEIEKFLDTPVKRYSSGMYVRLAFAVAAHLEPEILIVDEVLAVGDAEFQKKCMGKMGEVAGQGRTVLFVSHNMGVIASLCQTAIWLEKNGVREVGPARPITGEYLARGASGRERLISLAEIARSPHVAQDDRLRFESLEWLTVPPLRHGEPVRALIRFRTRSPVREVSFGIGFSSLDGNRLLTYETDFHDGFRPDLLEAGGHFTVEVAIPSLPIAPDLYSVDVGCRSGDVHSLDFVLGCVQVEVIPGPTTPGYIVSKGAAVRLASEWSWGVRVPAGGAG